MLITTLQQKHPDYDAETLQAHRELYEGGKTFRASIEKWLPQNHAEMNDVWEDRKKRGFYINHVGEMLDMLGSFLFSEAVQVEGLDAYPGFLDDCDGAGSTWSEWWKALLLDAFQGKRAYAWVNLPSRPADLEVPNRFEEEKAGLLNAYLVGLSAEQVIDWETDERGQLQWVMVHGVKSRRASIDGPRKSVHVWTYIDAEVIRRWEWEPTKEKPAPGDKDEANELPIVKHGVGRLPVVRLELPHGLWALNKLHDPAVALMRRQNDLDWSLHRAAHALLAIYSKWADGTPTLGAGYYIRLGENDKAEYLEPSGMSFDAQSAQAEDLRQELYRVLHQMAASVSPEGAQAVASGASKALDWQALEIVLLAYGELVLKAMRSTLAIIAKVRGVDAESIKVKGLQSWKLEDLKSFLEAALAGDGLVKSETYKREVGKRAASRLLQDEVPPEVMEKIHAEIDAAEYEQPAYPPPPADLKRPRTKDDDDGGEDNA